MSIIEAVATHKYVISFCVGLELVTAKTPFKLFAVYMAAFALVSPLGVAIGIGISSGAGSGGDSYTFTVAVLQVRTIQQSDKKYFLQNLYII